MRFKGFKKVKGRRPVVRDDGRIDSVKTIVKPLPVSPPKADSSRKVQPPLVLASVPKADSVITLNAVLFDFDSYTLGKAISATLDSLASFINQRSLLEVRISGHTDNVGRESHNLRLSSKRAEAVAEYLIQKGVGQERVSFQGFGSSQPVLTNDTDEGKRRNRRVEILIHEKR